jgi:hypothetical protein
MPVSAVNCLYLLVAQVLEFLVQPGLINHRDRDCGSRLGRSLATLPRQEQEEEEKNTNRGEKPSRRPERRGAHVRRCLDSPPMVEQAQADRPQRSRSRVNG